MNSNFGSLGLVKCTNNIHFGMGYCKREGADDVVPQSGPRTRNQPSLPGLITARGGAFIGCTFCSLGVRGTRDGRETRQGGASGGGLQHVGLFAAHSTYDNDYPITA
jgi:hypothetical protein